MLDLIVHWPKGIKGQGEVRTQYHHISDIAPTFLDILGLKVPDSIDGVPQKPMDGVSMRYSFNDAKAPSPKKGSAKFLGNLRTDPTQPHFQLLDLMSVRFMLVPKKDGSLRRQLVRAGWRLAFSPPTGAHIVYENPESLPRA